MGMRTEIVVPARSRPAGACVVVVSGRTEEADMKTQAFPVVRWSCAAAIFWLAPSIVRAQDPGPPPQQQTVCTRRGPIHRLFHHSAHTVQDKMIGYPEAFVEPPLGYYINEQFTIQVAKADPHRFMLYRSDFLPGTSQFSPIGASRFNIMFTRLPSAVGPVAVEWTPEQPALAEARRQAVLATLAQAGQPLVANRVVIAPSPYPGAMGVEATNNYMNTTNRNMQAPLGFALPPAESASQGVR
jgi:hypothetical protein